MPLKYFDSILCWLAAALLCAGAEATPAGLSADGQIADLPGPVRQTVAAVLGSGRLIDVWPTNENGHAVFEIEMRQRGVDRAFTVANDGSLLAKQMFLNELPPSIQQTMRRETAGSQVGDIYWINDDGDPVYYAEFDKAQQHGALSVAPDGWVASRQRPLKESPVAVQAAIREKLQGRVPTGVDRADDGDQVTYEVTDLVQGREQLWILNPDGSVAAEPSSLNVLPAPARATLIRQSAGARVVHVFKIPESGSTLYEVASVRENARQVCTVDATGRIVSEELPLKRLPPLLQKAINAKADGRFIVRIERFPDEKNATCDVTLRRQGKIEIITFGVDGSVQ